MPITVQQRLEPEPNIPHLHHSDRVPIDEYFPEEAANSLAVIESYNKHLYRPNTYLHKWWARRSGTTFRHILKQLVDLEEKQDFYEPGGLEGKVIFDPMMGGGTTLHEAIRMGANVIGIDIDPIPVAQAKATLTISTLSHKEKIFNRFIKKLRNEFAKLYETSCPLCKNVAETQFLLYGVRKKCSCGESVFVDSYILRHNNHNDVIICLYCREVFTTGDHICKMNEGIRLIEKGIKHCDVCKGKFIDILDESFVNRYVPLVVVGSCSNDGQFFKGVDAADLEKITHSQELVQQISLGDNKWFKIPDGPKSNDLIRRGITNYTELFTPRQLLYLYRSHKLLERIGPEDRIWLGLLVSTSLEFNSLLCGYKGRDIRRPGAIRHVFSHHAYSFPHTALENNPIFSGNTSGTLNRLFRDRIIRGGRWALTPVEIQINNGKRRKVTLTGEIDGGRFVNDWSSVSDGIRKIFIQQNDAAHLDIPEEIADYVVTDPPYYDSVQYSDLSNFFRVWLRLFLPEEFLWTYNPHASAVSEGSNSRNQRYAEMLEKIWKTCHTSLKKERGRLVFTFHHWNYNAWSELTISLKRANFFLVNRYVVHSENPSSVHIKGLKSLKHDTILVLKPRLKSVEENQWTMPVEINTTDSYAFCSDCGEALGYFLNSNLAEETILQSWRGLIGGSNDG